MRINAREGSAEAGGKDRLSGQQIMGIWDALCTLLATREVTVEDVSNKGSMLLRVLHVAAYGTTWYVWGVPW